MSSRTITTVSDLYDELGGTPCRLNHELSLVVTVDGIEYTVPFDPNIRVDVQDGRVEFDIGDIETLIANS